MPELPRALVQRTFEFAQAVRHFVDRLPRSVSNYEDVKQVVRSSGSVAANYLEAQEGLSRKDFFYRIKVCRKEARESGLWLRLLAVGSDLALAAERDKLATEAEELKRIFWPRGFASKVAWTEFCDRFAVYPFNDAVAWRAAEIFHDLRKRRAMTGENDLWIAATALEAGGVLVTRNVKHLQQVRGLKVLPH